MAYGVYGLAADLGARAADVANGKGLLEKVGMEDVKVIGSAVGSLYAVSMFPLTWQTNSVVQFLSTYGLYTPVTYALVQYISGADKDLLMGKGSGSDYLRLAGMVAGAKFIPGLIWGVLGSQ